MEPKKNVLLRLREKAKPLFNMKKGKKAKKTPLRYRRSISVPDLRCSSPSLLDSLAVSPDPDTASFSGLKRQFYLDEAEIETSSLAYSDNFVVTDEPLSVKSSNQFTFPADMDHRDRTTRWYIDYLDNESACSTPSEERSCSPCLPEQELTAGPDNIPSLSREIPYLRTGSVQGSAVSSEIQPVPAGQKVQYLLTINLKEGRHLVIRDRNGTSDPYVKFRLDGKTIYKSKVVCKNLNPAWYESFSVFIRDLDQCMYVKVYDRDLRSRDFMGSSTINLSKLEIDKYLTLRLEDPGSLKEDMGVILLDACVSIHEGPTKRNKWPLKRKGSFNKGHPQHGRIAAPSAQKSQVWSGVYTLVLVEGQDMPEGSQGDVYVRFRLGEQRCRSRCLCVRASPQWRETFDFNRFSEGQPDVLAAEVLCKRSRKSEELWGTLELDLTQMPLNKKRLYTPVVGAGKGRLLLLLSYKPCFGVSICELSSAPLDDAPHRDRIQDLRNTLSSLQDVGYLQVKVVRAMDLASTDLSGKSDPFCVLELGNSKLQTPTIYKTIHPEWRTAFTLPIKDIHDVLMLTVCGEDGDKSPDILGKVAIPLLTVTNGQLITSLLKKEDLAGPSKGTITLELSVLYNPARAAIKTFKPRETKFEEDNPKFNKKLLARNIYRVRRLSMAVLYTLQYIKSCFQWESTQRSITAFLIFLVTVWHFELFMLPLFLLLLFGWKYFHISHGAGSQAHDLVSARHPHPRHVESEKRGLMEKIHMIQEIVLTVQNVLDEVACIGERVKNTFNWSVPFLSLLACCTLIVATAALYYFPLRYIVLLWGVNKFTKKLRNPHTIDNNELLDFLQRVPSDIQKVRVHFYIEMESEGQQEYPLMMAP
uniref:C2 domain-containing protein n=1 Tax=Electrophorus electricus TaxID=8005 RepID=A0AAY5E7E5_ELEEL